MPEPYHRQDGATLYLGDCLTILPTLPSHSVDALVTDPPAGISFMGQEWDRPSGFRSSERGGVGAACPTARMQYRGASIRDSASGRATFIAQMTAVFTEARRVLKPGGHALVWALPRTAHWTATALEDAGFEVRDCITALFGTGFPKSLNVSKVLRERGETCRCLTDDIQLEHENTEATPHLRDVRADVHPEEQSSAQQSEVLLIPLHMEGKGSGPCSDSTPAGASSQHERAQADGPALWASESSLEGRGNVLAKARELQADQVRAMPDAVPTNGAEGRLCNGASVADGPTDRPLPEPNGSSPPRRPRPAQQQPRQPGAMARQSEPQDGGAWPSCHRCGLPVVPDGLGTALKPSAEFWWLCRAPLSEPTVAANVARWSVGALNIDGCRVQGGGPHGTEGRKKFDGFNQTGDVLNIATGDFHRQKSPPNTSGRWPSNCVLSHTLWCHPTGATRRVKAHWSQPTERTTSASWFGTRGKAADRAIGYADPDGVEQVDAWECAEGGVIAAPEFSSTNGVLSPLDAPDTLRDQLGAWLQLIPSCSTTCSNPWPRESAPAGSAHIQSAAMEGGRDYVDSYARMLSALPGFRACCPTCRGSCDARLRQAQEAARVGPQPLADALVAVHQWLLARADNPLSLPTVPLSSSDGVDQFDTAPRSGSSKIAEAVQHSRRAVETRCRTLDTLLQPQLPFGLHDSKPMSSMGGCDGNSETTDHSACIDAMTRLIVACVGSWMAQMWPQIIQQSEIVINLPGCPVALLDRQSGERRSGGGVRNPYGRDNGALAHQGVNKMHRNGRQDTAREWDASMGGASRFFPTFPADAPTRMLYQPKPSTAERNRGLPPGERSNHPTVKSISLMSWLCCLITPPGTPERPAVILDPFMGSGSTGIAALAGGWAFIGIEQDETYLRTAIQRLSVPV